jgi:phage gp45-like
MTNGQMVEIHCLTGVHVAASLRCVIVAEATTHTKGNVNLTMEKYDSATFRFSTALTSWIQTENSTNN